MNSLIIKMVCWPRKSGRWRFLLLAKNFIRYCKTSGIEKKNSFFVLFLRCLSPILHVGHNEEIGWSVLVADLFLGFDQMDG